METFDLVKQQLSETHKRVSDYYKRMSKVSDNYSFNIIQKSIDAELANAARLKEKLEVLRKDMLENWKIGIPEIIHTK